ncbi:hypothetical protein GQ55_5G018100 [Panicum hallii var. hallii]|uniref:Uncharacterized protein n=1 Tax=Panicum hallii var. hallii TaxID=1504633 RepID=A0A2T7DBL5_9POAL|nr:hypothetical protein GQ55_5G018100 [Panicum hallii var. hallii]
MAELDALLGGCLGQANGPLWPSLGDGEIEQVAAESSTWRWKQQNDRAPAAADEIENRRWAYTRKEKTATATEQGPPFPPVGEGGEGGIRGSQVRSCWSDFSPSPPILEVGS